MKRSFSNLFSPLPKRLNHWSTQNPGWQFSHSSNFLSVSKRALPAGLLLLRLDLFLMLTISPCLTPLLVWEMILTYLKLWWSIFFLFQIAFLRLYIYLIIIWKHVPSIPGDDQQKARQCVQNIYYGTFYSF